MNLFCTRCQLALPRGSERCPQCLRTSTLVDRDARGADVGLTFPVESGESYVGLRIAVLAAAWTFAALASWLLLPQQGWLEPRRLWLPAILWTGCLWLLPLRAAFRAPRSEEGPREALRALALLTAQVIGLGCLFALVIAGICQLTDNVMVALTGGLALFIAGLLLAPAMRAGLTGEKPLGEVLPKALAKAALGVLCVGALMGLAALRGEQRREARSVTIPRAPEVLQEIADAQNVPVTSARASTDAGTVIHLRADGGSFDRTMMRLETAALDAMADLKDEPHLDLDQGSAAQTR